MAAAVSSTTTANCLLKYRVPAARAVIGGGGVATAVVVKEHEMLTLVADYV